MSTHEGCPFWCQSCASANWRPNYIVWEPNLKFCISRMLCHILYIYIPPLSLSKTRSRNSDTEAQWTSDSQGSTQGSCCENCLKLTKFIWNDLLKQFPMQTAFRFVRQEHLLKIEIPALLFLVNLCSRTKHLQRIAKVHLMQAYTSYSRWSLIFVRSISLPSMISNELPRAEGLTILLPAATWAPRLQIQTLKILNSSRHLVHPLQFTFLKGKYNNTSGLHFSLLQVIESSIARLD